MKFGKLMETLIEPNLKKEYINYDYLKGKIKYSQNISSLEFIKLLSSEINKTETYYKGHQRLPLKNYCILNVLAVLKITKKYNKHNEENITKQIYDYLHNQTFYKALFECDFVTMYDTSDECVICYESNKYTLHLPCNHSICWNCCLKCYSNNYKKCPCCLQDFILNPLIIKLEEITNNICNPVYKELFEPQKKLLFIGIDGLRPDCLLFSKTPNIDKLIQSGSFSFDTKINSMTVSAPSWTSIFTGKTPTFTGITMNETCEKKSFKLNYQNLFKELNEKNVNTSCLLSSWEGIPNIVHDSNSVIFHNEDDVNKNDEKIIYLTKKKIQSEITGDQFIFCYLNSVDFIGHKEGFSLQSKEYINQIETVDCMLEDMINEAMKKKWNVIITTDHGGCQYKDLDTKQKQVFNHLDNVQSQIKKKNIGVHGLDIPQHNRVFQIFWGDQFETKEIIEPKLSTDIYKTIISFFSL